MQLNAYFDSLVEGVAKKLEEKPPARRLLIYETGRIGQKLFDPNFASAWTGVFMPFEIFQAMDVGAVFIEFTGAMLASTGQSVAFLEIAEKAGYPSDGCGYHRAMIGATRQGLLGTPQLLIGATVPCDGGLKTITALSRSLGVEPFIFDIPFPPVTREKIDYLVAQYRAMEDYITRLTGKTLDPGRLKLAARYSNQTTRLLHELYTLCKQTPSPINSDTLKNFQIILALLTGSEEGVKVAQTFVNETRAHAQNNCAGLAPEKYRLLWVQNRIQYKNTLLDYLQDEYRAKIVIDELNHIYWDDLDEDNPLESMAVRQIEHPLNGDMDRRIETLLQLAKDYNIHGAINPSHWGCRQNSGGRQIMKDAFQSIGVPFINLDVDCINPRNFFEGQMPTRLQSFMEMIAQ